MPVYADKAKPYTVAPRRGQGTAQTHLPKYRATFSTSTSSTSSCYWQANLPSTIFSTPAHVWSENDWQQIRKVYRRGRAVLYPHALTEENVEQGLQLLDRIAEALPSNFDSQPTLDDPWLVSAWRHVAVEQAQRLPELVNWENLQHVVQRIDRYLEQGVLAWDPHMLIWILDAWQASNPDYLQPRKAFKLVQRLTRDYAADRPADNYVITRLLQYLARTKEDPERADALVHQYLQQVEQQAESTALDVHVYTAWVHAWAVSNRKDAGTHSLRILRRAHNDQCATVVLYNVVLNALCRCNDTVQAAILWQELQASDIPVTANTWHPLLQAYLRIQAWRPALQLWRACEKHVKTNVSPHRTAHNTLTKTLERDLSKWDVSLKHEESSDGKQMHLHERINDWDRVAEEWNVKVQVFHENKKNPSHADLAAAMTFLDRLCYAAFLQPSPWTVSARDTDAMVDFYKRLPKPTVQRDDKREETQPIVTLNHMIRSLRKYQGIGLVHPGGEALDFIMDGISKSSVLSPTEVALTAESLLDEVVEDCQHDVHHPDFINKLPLLRLMKMWSETPDSPAAVEVVWERLWRWYAQSGGNKQFDPDENFYKVLLRAWTLSDRITPQEAAQRALELWQTRLEQVGRKPSIAFCHQVTAALAEAGDTESTESWVNEVIQSYQSGETHMRNDLDFLSLLFLARCRAGQLSGAAQTLDDLERLSKKNGDPYIQPSNLCYNIMLAELAKGDEIKKALAILNRMAKLASAGPERKIHPSVSSWMTILAALARSDSTEAADQALRLLDMSNKLRKRFGNCMTVAPDLFMYNCILECFLRNPDPRKFIPTAESFLNRMESNKGDVRPDNETYELLLRLLVKAQLPGEASRHLVRFCSLSEKRIVPAEPSTSHFHTVILGFLQLGDPKRITAVVPLVQVMFGLARKTDWSVRPNNETFRLILQGCKNSQADPSIAEDVLTMMERNALVDGENAWKPDIEMYVDVIGCWASKGGPEARKRILKLAEHIPRYRTAQDSELFRTLLDTYIKSGSIDMAQSLTDAISGVPGHCRVALDTWIEAKDYERAAGISDHIARGEFPTPLVRDAIRAWKKSKLPDAGASAERLLQSMENSTDKDYSLDSSVYSDVLLSYHNGEDPDMVAAAERLVQKCRDNGGAVDLRFLEVAATIYLSRPDDRTLERVIGIFDDIRKVEDSAWFSQGKDMCSRLKAVIVGSNVDTKGILLDKLVEVISCRIHTNENETPATLL